MKPITSQAYKLFHEGCIALSQMEYNGICIDTEYLEGAIERAELKIGKLYKALKQDKIYKTWKKRYGQKTNLGSHQQLGKILFDVMKYPCPARTKTGRPKTDARILETIDLKFIRRFLRIEKLKKAKGTYLQGILRETMNGFLHPFFSLHTASSYRGSSDDPNFQNIPIKDPEISELIRRCFIPRSRNRQIVETDFKRIEICGAACYHHDPRMIRYIENPKKDLHRDMAAKCYMLSKDQVSYWIRDSGKNRFVFPQFYGDYYLACAQNMWRALDELKLKTVDGLNLKKHLRRKGITALGECDPSKEPLPGTFEEHLQKVEYDFWHKFRVYAAWKETWWSEYLSKGYFDTLSGFRVSGFLRKNQVINMPVQGTSFHFLLWSLIRINKLLKKYKMKSLIIGQIHDSLVGDIPKSELEDFCEIAQQVMTVDLLKHWDWIIVPMAIEIDAAPPGLSWFEKEKVKI